MILEVDDSNAYFQKSLKKTKKTQPFKKYKKLVDQDLEGLKLRLKTMWPDKGIPKWAHKITGIENCENAEGNFQFFKCLMHLKYPDFKTLTAIG